MSGRAESLNVTVAAALLLFASGRAHHDGAESSTAPIARAAASSVATDAMDATDATDATDAAGRAAASSAESAHTKPSRATPSKGKRRG
jgi:hypothetical protein